MKVDSLFETMQEVRTIRERRQYYAYQKWISEEITRRQQEIYNRPKNKIIRSIKGIVKYLSEIYNHIFNPNSWRRRDEER